MLLFGHTTSADLDPVDAPEDALLVSEFTPPDDCLISKLSAYMDGNGSADSDQSFRAVIYDSTGSLVASSPVRTVLNLAEPEWIDFVFDRPVAVTSEPYLFGLHTGPFADAARVYASAETENAAIIADGFSDGPPVSGVEPVWEEGELGLFLTFAYAWQPPDEDDQYLANLGFYSAQQALGRVGDPRFRSRVYATWHGTYLDPEPQGASLAIVQSGGALSDWVGRRVRITGALGRGVSVYIHQELDLDLEDETQISLSRRAWQALGRLSNDTLLVTVEEIKPEDTDGV